MREDLKQRKKIDIKKVTNPDEKKILLFLHHRGKCIYGEIMKELQISSTRGQEAIYSLMTKGMVRHKDRTSYLELNVELMH
jgi:predicted transcriptional regulator